MQIETRAAQEKRVREMMTMLDFGELLEQPKCAACGAPAVQRCSRCKNEWYCSRKCQVGVWKKHKAVCDILARDAQTQAVQAS